VSCLNSICSTKLRESPPPHGPPETGGVGRRQNGRPQQDAVRYYVYNGYYKLLLHTRQSVFELFNRYLDWWSTYTNRNREKIWRKRQKNFPIFSKWEYFCQNGRIIRPFWQQYLRKFGKSPSYSPNLPTIFPSVRTIHCFQLEWRF